MFRDRSTRTTGAGAMRIRRRAFVGVLLLCAACSPTGTDPEYVRELGVLAEPGLSEQVQVPASARAGQPFTVSVTTWGSSCRRTAPAEVSRIGLQADVTVYDLNPVGGPCDRAIRPMEHVVELRFPQPGTATIHIHGRTFDVEGRPVPLTIERTLTIQ